MRSAASDIPGCAEQATRLRNCLDEIEEHLAHVPAIEVAFIGPSRNGKSTLMNALANLSILPTSDTKPCTASISRLRWAEEWSMTVKFIDKDQFKNEWQDAVKDAEDFLKRQAANSDGDEPPDDPRYLHSTLQRFIKFFRLDPEEDPAVLVQQIRDSKVTGDLAKCFGATRQPKENNLDLFRRVVSQYLSTEDVYWTIVESCEICGPFEGWHPKLALVDLPGTNDTNAQRTSITDSLRERSQAVAIVTGESNLGIDIESWLQNSRVLADFLEARDS